MQSSKSMKRGNIRQARVYGMIAAYLNFTAIAVALVVACLSIGLVVGLYGYEYSLQQCINKGMESIISFCIIPLSSTSI